MAVVHGMTVQTNDSSYEDQIISLGSDNAMPLSQLPPDVQQFINENR